MTTPSSVFTNNPLETIDISRLDQLTADKLLNAAKSQGFMMVEGHGFTQAEVDELFQLSKTFFDLPDELKVEHAINEGNYGYTGIGTENLDETIGDPKEAFNFAYVNLKTGKAEHKLPDLFTMPNNDVLVTNMIFKFRDTVHRVLRLLAMGLKIDSRFGGVEWFVERNDINKPSGSALRFLHYPSPKIPSNVSLDDFMNSNRNKNVAGEHTDYGQLTRLLQREGESGLQILSPLSKKWENVPFVAASKKYQDLGEAAPLILNIGDQLSYWTDGMLKSTVHRVRLGEDMLRNGRSRYSIVFFSHPSSDTELVPVPSKIVVGGSNNGRSKRGASYEVEKAGKPITSMEHLQRRISAAYGRGV
ncbi:hypothetical protein CANARDRAFT_28682 [[Candida] arabinofermentans NRRL YB-2248]|uniref:Fe2OG dioxygenase domain-containing protein n=1 Tax=[Candida] arabinofermentans NRRL YB-2248 TaxID=983967 RepID=A0A1E4SZM5_9ASCO|nr:hypothetical protein CANARDRAFT_28682 [[Candida] arabinofermentans NRRL YB-2248]